MSADPGRHEGDRLQQIATMYAEYHATLHGIVRRRGSKSPTSSTMPVSTHGLSSSSLTTSTCDRLVRVRSPG
jgi:hypothetical protein